MTKTDAGRRPATTRRISTFLAAAAFCAAWILPALPSGRAAQPEERMKVRGVVPDPRSKTPVLLLEDLKTGRTVLPLWIGVPEANAILMALRHVDVPRPMTHDLLRNLLSRLKARVGRVVIHNLRENTFLATIHLRTADGWLRVDSRPSDAVALALRTDAPIFVSALVLARAGQVRPEEDSLTSELKDYGLTVQEITAELLPHFQGANTGSILITDVRVGSRGTRDGLKRGDVVLQINDLRVRGLENFMRLLQSAGTRKESARLLVNRGNGRLRLTLSGN